MPTIVHPKPAYRVARGDILVFPPRAPIGPVGRHRKPSSLDLYIGSGQFEVCGRMLADDVVKVFVLDENLENHMIPFYFDTSVDTLEFI